MHIALYLAADGELDTGPLTDFARSQDKQLYLPVIQPDNSLHFAQWNSGDSLTTNRLGIPEPGPDAMRCAARELEQLGINCNLTLLFGFCQAAACAAVMDTEVGYWAEFDLSGAPNDEVSSLRFAIVERPGEADKTWYEFSAVTNQGPVIVQLDVPGWPFETTDVTGVIVKMDGSRIETEVGAQFIAEGEHLN